MGKAAGVARMNRSNPSKTPSLKVATHYHYAAIARALAEAEQGGDMPNAGRSFSRVKRSFEAQAAA
jgi:hypothetical protein